MSGRVKIYNYSLLKELNTANQLEGRNKTTKKTKEIRNSEKNLSTTAEEKAEYRYREYWKQQEKRNIDADRRVKERVATNIQMKEACFSQLEESLKMTTEWVSEVDNMVKLTDEIKRLKAEEMYANWHERVYGAIQNKITLELNSVDQKQLSEKKRQVFQQFLDATNSKGSLFLDTVVEGDYDPMILNTMCIKAKTHKLNDPIKRVITKYEEEKSMVDPTLMKVEPAGGRETLNILMWGSGKIESTPHGHFAKMHGSGVQYHNRRVPTHDDLSNVNMNHFNVATGGDAMRNEFPPHRRTLNTMKQHEKSLYVSKEIKRAGSVTNGGPALASTRGPVIITENRREQERNPLSF